MSYTEQEKRAAYHQAGHAVVAYRLLGDAVSLPKGLSLQRDAADSLVFYCRFRSDPTEDVRMTIALAGFRAEAEAPGLGGWKSEWNESEWYPLCPIRKELKRHDADLMLQCTVDRGHGSSSMDLSTSKEAAFRLVRDNWTAIEQVAEKLLAEKSVSELDIWKIMGLES